MIDNHKKIAAGIVLFNPENKVRLEKSINSVINQIDKIYIFDNSTEVIEFEFLDGVTYITEGENKGIAYALNRIMEQAESDGYSWVLTMDQDSILPDGMAKDFLRYTNYEEGVGIICPQVIDKRRVYMSVDAKEDCVEHLEMCITSASCTSIEAWKAVGKFDEWLFVDLVDNEFCKRLIVSGYKILQIKKWVLDQEFGKIVPKSRKQQAFWVKVSKILHNQNFAKFSYKKSVSSLRVYYTCRNIIYVNRKMKNYGATAYENYNCKGYIGFVISFVIPSVLRANKKFKVLKAAIAGTRDGLLTKPVPWLVK